LEQEQDFFYNKKPWSKYKDLILDYYLQPYLQKIKNLRKPILVVDCFAGQGRFDDGESGSPLIILEKLQKLHQEEYKVTGYFIETVESRYEKLKRNMEGSIVPLVTRRGDFRNFVPEIARLAKDSSVFVYLDPLKPSQLLFEDMKLVYDNLQEGRSVETLINFMSWSFLRGVWGIQEKILSNDKVLPDHPLTLRLNKIAGGTYWQKIAFEYVGSESERAEKLAEGYASTLHTTGFAYVLKYAIRNKYEDQSPKYHLIFGSRHPDALELMNRAMVKARREFVKKGFIDGYLFPNQPDKEVIKPKEIEKVVVDTAKRVGKTTWKNLRVQTTIANPSIYTDSEFNRAIKEAIKTGKLKSSCAGTKIEEDAMVWSS
jgi:three-Cys-motif partner protein